MIFEWLGLENFRTFVKPARLPLREQGLVIVRGDNKVSQSCTDNGCGKTGILHGLSWVLGGRDLDGAGAADVACRFNDRPGRGELSMIDGTTGWRIERECRPTDFRLYRSEERVGEAGVPGDAKALQQAVWDACGWGPLVLRNAVIFGQGAFDRFATAEASEQMRMLDEITGVSFKAALERAKAWRDEWRDRFNGLLQEQDLLRERQEGALGQVEELREALAVFTAGKQERLREAERLVATAAQEVADRLKALDVVKKQAKRAKALREKWDRIEELKADLDAKGKDAERQQFVRDRLKGELKNAAARLDALLALGRCPTCRTKFTGKTAPGVRAAFKPEAQADRAKCQEAERAVATANAAWREASAVLERHLKALPGMDERTVANIEAESGKAALERYRRALEDAYARETETKKALAAERKRTWEGQAALDGARKQTEKAEAGLVENAAQQRRAKATVAAAEYWVEAFGDRGLRALLFESNADFLNERLARHLETLTAGEAAAVFSATEALKGGTTRERLNLAASWDWGAAGYKPSSEGQRRRLDLALFMAVQDVAEYRSAKQFPLKAFDDAAESLDAQGREIFCRWVKTEARSRGTVLFITHDSEMESNLDPDQVWTVILERDGARVELGGT